MTGTLLSFGLSGTTARSLGRARAMPLEKTPDFPRASIVPLRASTDNVNEIMYKAERRATRATCRATRYVTVTKLPRATAVPLNRRVA